MSSPITTILLLSANPIGTASQRLDQEKREIFEGLQRSSHRDRFRLESRAAVRPRDLQVQVAQAKRGNGLLRVVFAEIGGSYRILTLCWTNQAVLAGGK